MKITRFGYLLCALLMAALVIPACVPKAKPPAELQEFKIPLSGDYSGPYADIMKYIDAGNKAVFAWWNEEYGKKLGIKLTAKVYDTRYDPAVVAGIYPGAVAEFKPLAWLGLGGPCVAALKEKVPYDKIPLVMSTATYGYDWKAINWIIQPRPTYPHEFAGWVDWALKNKWKESRPMRIAAVSNDKPAAYVDGEKGAKKFLTEVYAGKVEYLGCAWVDLVPVDVTDAIRPFVQQGVDYFWIMTNIPHVVVTTKSCDALGVHVPVITSTHNDMTILSKVLDFEKMEGFYDTGNVASALHYEIPAYKEIWLKYLPAGMDPVNDWTLTTVQFSLSSLIVCRAIEKAVARVGAENLSGEAVYESLFEPWKKEDVMGLSPGLGWTKDAPFPKEETLGVMMSTVKDGKHVLAVDQFQPVPKIPKW